MSNARRPSTARKHTRKTEEGREAALDAGMVITVDGERYEVRLGDVTPAIARSVRREYGFGVQSMIGHLANDPDLDLLTAFMWVARQIRGEHVDLAAVEEGVRYADLMDADFEIASPEDVSELPPEA